MSILRAITRSGNEDRDGHEVTIRSGKLDRCPGCAQHGVEVVKKEKDKVYVINGHNIEAVCGGAVTRCEYSWVPLFVCSQEQTQKETEDHND